MKILYFFLCLVFIGCIYSIHHSTKAPIVTLGLMGDVMIGRLVSESIQQHGPTYCWGSMLPLLKTHDVNIINLETTFTNSMHPVPKVFNFKSNPVNVLALIAGTITIANIANNHILDFSIEGLQDTLSTLDSAHILHVGAGMSLYDAQQPCIVERNGIRIGVIGATDNEPTWRATLNKPGTNYFALNDYGNLIGQIKQLRPHVDCLIMSLHWGQNWPDTITDEMSACAHALINAGADIIHGHSPHITLGIEQYNNKLIIYSAGDFVDDYMVGPKERNDHTVLFQITINQNGISTITLIPGIIQNMQVNRAHSNEAFEILSRIQKLSENNNTHLVLQDDTLVAKK